MLNHKYFGLPVWTWIIIISIIIFSCKQTLNVKSEANLNNINSKEKFAEISKPKIKIFNFNTEWCGWSKRFQPEWDAFSKEMKQNFPNIEAIDVKCDQDVNQKICEQYQVPGYPYVIIEIDNKQTPYNGERTTEALMAHAKTL